MWQSIPSLNVILQGLSHVFTGPSMHTCVAMLLGWVMCPGKRTEYKVFETIHADEPISRDERHPFDRYYNFFSRSAWTTCELSHELAQAVVESLADDGPLTFVIDDTLLHKRGKDVYGLGWFYDAVASSETRTATATGNNWVVLGIAIPVPGVPDRFLCLPLQARLHLAGEEHPSCQDLAGQMIAEIAGWFPNREILFVGDGGYSAHQMLEKLPPNVTYVGLMRMDAVLYDPQVPPQPAGKRGRKPTKGPRLPKPREMAKQADKASKKSGTASKTKNSTAKTSKTKNSTAKNSTAKNSTAKTSTAKTSKTKNSKTKNSTAKTCQTKNSTAKTSKTQPKNNSPDCWQQIQTTAYGKQRTLLVLTRLVLWPKVCGPRPIRIAIIRDPEGELRDLCLYTTDVNATAEWIIATYACRCCIEQTFRASKQYLQIEAPHHWCRQSIEKLAPWVWQMQSVIILWYLTAGRDTTQAEARRQRMGPWDSEWSLRHMLQTLRDAVLEQTISPMLSNPDDQKKLIQLLTDCLKLAV